MISKASNLRELFQSKVDLTQKRATGKNPPPKLPNNRPRAVPSIPSVTVAPPEDKSMTMTTFHQTSMNAVMRETDKLSPFAQNVARQSDYLKTIEKGNNPNVGPGSYDPIVKPKLQATL